eukprot:1155993-Pelagomonas_calceolata.AAC.11
MGIQWELGAQPTACELLQEQLLGQMLAASGAWNCFLASLESIQGFELGAGCLAAGGGVGSLASSMQVAGIGLCLSALLCALCQKLSACNTHPSMLRYCGRPSVACALPLPLLAQSCAMHGRVCDHRNRRVACARTRQDV